MILSFVVSIFAASGIANAQADVLTYPFIDAIPKPAGVGQPVLINFGLLNNLARDGDGWNVTAVITDPDGHTETFARMTWSTGTVGFTYVPQKTGDYKLQCRFDRVYYTSGSNSVPTGYYAASESEVIILTVTEEWKPEHPGYDMPSEYWTRPINAQLREWWSIAGSWVAKPNNAFAPYNAAPESAHILWTMPIGDTMGGLSGGNNYEVSYQDGDAYEGKFAGSVIIAGVLYYNKYSTYSGSTVAAHQTIVAVDIHTGEKLWERSYDLGNGRISTGQILTWISMNNRGTWAYLWITGGTTMYALDARTGDPIYNMTNVPAGTIYYGPNGEMLKYQLVNYGTAESPNYHLLQWNSSYVVAKDKIGSQDAWGSQVQNRVYNATERGYDINVSIGVGNVITGNIIYAFPEDRVVYGRATSQNITLSAISIKPGDEGRILFKNVNWHSPIDMESIATETYTQSQWSAISQEDMVVTYWVKSSRINYAFSLETGQFMWKSSPQTYADAWVAGSLGRSNIIVYHKLISVAAGGIVYCRDIKTGELLWTYDADDKYTESYLAPNWWVTPQFVSCGIVYFGHEEHSPQEPKPRGSPYFALNVETGEEVWRIDGAFRQTQWGGRSMIGDSIIVTQDTFDQQIYAIGKGPSAMTLSAPNVAVAAKTPLLLQGTIMDISPGTDSKDIQFRFPNGLPAVSDACMSEWMLYVYKQFNRPNDATGVPITVCVIDPNGNDSYLNTVSNANGNYAVKFTPEIEGDYEIYAYFDGSASYYGSSAEGKLIVSTTGSTDADGATAYEWYIVGMGIAIIATVILVGLWIKKK